MLCAAFVLKVFQLRDAPPADSEGQVPFTFRVARLFEKWSTDLPDQKALTKQFADAKVVEIYGITFFNALIVSDEFPDILKQRLQDPNKTTRILLMDPNGEEIKRRNANSLPGRDLQAKAKRWHEILDPIAREYSSKKFYFTFDYATTFAMLRFDDIAYVNLQLLTKCGSSPGLEVQENGWLFPHYKAEFERAWMPFVSPASTPNIEQ